MSLKARYSLVLSLVLSVLLLLFSAFIYERVKTQLVNTAERTLSAYLDHEWHHLEMKNGEVEGPSKTLFHKDIFYSLMRDGRIIFDTLPRVPIFGLAPSARLKDFQILKKKKQLHGSEFELTGYLELSSALSYLRALRRVLIFGACCAILALVAISWLTAYSILTPFQVLSRQTKELDAAKLSFRFDKPVRNDEYGILVENFNSLLSRLDRSFASLRRFSMNASHELKTPIAIAMGETELLLLRPRPAEEYQEGLKSIAGQLESLNTLISRLLFFSEMERLEVSNAVGKVDVLPFISRAVHALAKMNQVDERNVSFEAKPDTFFWGSAETFSSVVNNLVDNALKFSLRQVKISFSNSEGNFIFRVDDDGPGIPSEKAALFMEPLTQMRNVLSTLPSPIENARRPSHGLGLAIVVTCVEAMRGSLRLFESPLGGLAVEIILPQTSQT